MTGVFPSSSYKICFLIKNIFLTLLEKEYTDVSNSQWASILFGKRQGYISCMFS